MIVFFQMELHGLLPLLHDDLPHPLWGVDRAPLGLHAHSETSGQSASKNVQLDLVDDEAFENNSGGDDNDYDDE